MFKKLMNKKLLKNQKGLTLIELLAVIVILAIIAAIAVPAIGNIIQNSRYNAVKADAINVLNAANLYYTDNPSGENLTGGGSTQSQITVEQLISANYLDSSGKIPNGASVSNAVFPRELDTQVTNVVKGTITFSKATIAVINSDKEKGSKITSGYQVGTTK